jgi:Domain of unknown function (DUF4259)
MGAWGCGVFENDTALDWANRFSRSPSRRALSEPWYLVSRSGHAGDDQGIEALAAAEVLAAMAGKPSPVLPAALERWAAENRLEPLVPDMQLAAEAIQAIQHVSDYSELKDLFEGGGCLDEWLAVLEELIVRITAGIKAVAPRK